MSEQFSIKSNHSDREVVFARNEGEYFWVKLKGGITTEIRVYGYAPHNYDLADWFEKLGANKSPWPNELSWESLEGEFKISVNCTSLGHVHFVFSFRDLLGAYEESRIETGLETELGQLSNISNGARKFFAK